MNKRPAAALLKRIPPDLERDSENESEIKIYQPQDVAKAIAKPITLPGDVIRGILHLGGKGSVGGASKSRKSWLLIDTAIAVATGNKCLGDCETNKGRVLYANFELPEPFFLQRVKTICEKRQLALDPEMFEAHHLRGRVKVWEQIEPQIPFGKYSLIILDPSYKLLLLQSEALREESKSGAVTSLLERIDRLTVQTGAAVLFGAHFSKGDQSRKESIDRVSGSGVWGRDPDTIITFTELATPDSYAVEFTLRVHKPVEKFALRWEYPLFVPAVDLDPGDLKKAKGAAEKQFTVKDDLLPLLHPPLTPAKFKQKACERMSSATFYRLQKEARKTGAIHEMPNGKLRANPDHE
jgi:hypothetical protein